jgi:hypothetical protein
MSKNDDIVWQARCCLCGWKSPMGTLEQCEADTAQHVRAEHPLDFEMQAWLKDQEKD